MSDVAIRHVEPKDIDVIRQIHVQPEAHHNTLQVPHPLEHMWRERLTDTPGVKQLVVCIDKQVIGHSSIVVIQRSHHSRVADFGVSVDSRWYNRGVVSALMRTMTNMCGNWLWVERIELMVLADNALVTVIYKKYGFEVEGTDRRYALHDSEYVDAYCTTRMEQRAAGQWRPAVLRAFPASWES